MIAVSSISVRFSLSLESALFQSPVHPSGDYLKTCLRTAAKKISLLRGGHIRLDYCLWQWQVVPVAGGLPGLPVPPAHFVETNGDNETISLLGGRPRRDHWRPILESWCVGSRSAMPAGQVIYRSSSGSLENSEAI
jgi:hypothetical protein